MNIDNINTIEEAQKEQARLRRVTAEAESTFGVGSVEVRTARDAESDFYLAASEKLGRPEVEGCRQCKAFSVFGGPPHHGSSLCRCGRKPHCTCSACW